MAKGYKFQSTLPRGGATAHGKPGHMPEPVSIHAPARGSDRTQPAPPAGNECFNPRSRAGERPIR